MGYKGISIYKISNFSRVNRNSKRPLKLTLSLYVCVLFCMCWVGRILRLKTVDQDTSGISFCRQQELTIVKPFEVEHLAHILKPVMLSLTQW